MTGNQTRTLDFQAAIASPCTGCEAPCCTLLQLRQIGLGTLMDLDAIRYYLNFEKIEICIDQQMCASIFYSSPCNHLDQETARCNLHHTGKKPDICSHYNSYQCFYAKSWRDRRADEFPDGGELWLNPARFERLLESFAFDEARNIISWPQPEDFRMASQAVDSPQTREHDLSLPTTADQSPCTDCQAHCCTTLPIPMGIPNQYPDLDFLRYALGFPHVTLRISDQEWNLIIKSRCRHLTDNRCGIFGQSMRPLLCSLYDPNKCTYHQLFEAPPQFSLSVDLPRFEKLLATFQYNKQGVITSGLPTAAMHTYLQERAKLEMDECTPKRELVAYNAYRGCSQKGIKNCGQPQLGGSFPC